LAHEVEQSLALYKLLKAIGVPVEHTPMDAKVDREVLWPFAEAVVAEEGALSMRETGLLVEVTVGIENQSMRRREGALSTHSAPRVHITTLP